jgi:hypothetical protein
LNPIEEEVEAICVPPPLFPFVYGTLFDEKPLVEVAFYC